MSSVSYYTIITLLFLFTHPCFSKFNHTCPRTATDSVHACITQSAFTPSTITQRANCRGCLPMRHGAHPQPGAKRSEQWARDLGIRSFADVMSAVSFC
jgi:hypothetical protein